MSELSDRLKRLRKPLSDYYRSEPRDDWHLRRDGDHTTRHAMASSKWDTELADGKDDVRHGPNQ